MVQKNETVRLLILHESQDNAELIINALKNSGTATRPHLVEDEESVLDALKSGSWDIFLVGEATNGLTFDRVLQLVREEDKDIPTIVLLNEPDPELQLDAMQMGAADATPCDATQLLVQIMRREVANLQHRRARRKAESALHESEKRCELLLDNSRDAIAYVHDGMHIYANQAYVELFGYDGAEDMEGMPVIDLVAKEDLNSFKEYLRAYSKGERNSEDLHFAGLKADGSSIDAMMQLSSASYDGEPCTQIIIRRDDGKAAELAEKLREVVNQDGLTGLPNRQRFEENLAKSVNKARIDKSRFVVGYLTIDNLSQMRSTIGIAGTDAVIIDVAKELGRFYAAGTLSRFGDSSFTILVPDVDAESANRTATDACKAVRDHLIQTSGGKTVQTTLSIGLAMIGETASDATEMFSRALNTADKVKLGGGNGVSMFNISEHAEGDDNALMELLTDALENSKFKLLFQPLTDVMGEGSEFYEVFVRLPLNDGKLMTPDDFMKVAGRHQMGSRIDRWVLLTAAKMLKEHTRNDPTARMLVNLTAESLSDPSLPAWISKLTKAIDPNRQSIVVQFNEGDVVSYLKQAKEQTAALAAAGIPVSITRFGCTLNPLNTLKHATVDFIKLDRSFTQELSNEENMGNIKQMVGDLCAENKRVIVSFVENAQTLSKLWTLGVHFLQGYYLQPPGETLVYDQA